MNYAEMLEFVKNVAVEAGDKMLEIYNGTDFEIEIKSDNSPVTKADKVGNDHIIQRLQEKYPEIGILSEESKQSDDRFSKEYVWIIDPLDGTKEFIKRNGEFTVNIGLVKDGRPELGVVTIPAKGEAYVAAKGLGTHFQDNKGAISKVVSSDKSKIAEMTLVKSRSHASANLQKLLDKHHFAATRDSGSSIKICLIARGQAEVYYRFGPTNEWDICAAHCVLNEAGGRLTDIYGEEITYNKKDTLNKNGFIATNNTIHSYLIELGLQYK